jgi:predicted methyltransferase
MIQNTIVRVAMASAVAASLALVATNAGAADSRVPAYVQAAVDSLARPAYDKARDADRKPAETITFAGVKPGDKVLELIPMRNYYTRILSKVVGPKGTVYATMLPVSFPAPANAPPGPPPRGPISFSVDLARGSEFRNVVPMNAVSVGETGSVSAPEPVDVVWTSDNYHDFYNPPFGIKQGMAAFNKSMFDALKPGGVYMIIDHATAAGTGATQTGTLHRIDPAQVRKDAEAVGFVFDGQSSLLASASDDHSKPVFALRGKSDDFVLRFRKPKNVKTVRPPDSEMRAYFGNTMSLGSGEERVRTVFFLANHMVEDIGPADIIYGVWWLDANANMCFLHETATGPNEAGVVCTPNFFAASKSPKVGDSVAAGPGGNHATLMAGFVYPNVTPPPAPGAGPPPPPRD